MSTSISLQRDALLDRFAIGISGLCIVHCVASVLFLGLFASAAGALMNPMFHEVGLALAIGFGALALGRGMMTHGYMMPAAIGGLGLGVMMGALHLPHGGGETLWTVIGVALLALGHDLNRRALA
jgi:hypothetical protein